MNTALLIGALVGCIGGLVTMFIARSIRKRHRG